MADYHLQLQTARTAGILVGVLACGALSVSALSSAPPAHATCASFFGLGNSADCASGFGSVAIALGSGAVALADGLFSTALAVGDNAVSYTDPAGFLQFASALGNSADSEAYGVLALSVQVGNNGAARAENGIANIAVNLSQYPSFTLAKGSLNIAVNLLGRQVGDNVTTALGTGNIALNVGGANDVAAGEYVPDVPAIGSIAFSIFGTNNTVTAVPGPLAIAGSIGQNGATITKAGPGFNINGLRVGGAAAVNRKKAPAAAESRGSSTPRPAASVGNSMRATTKSAAAAARRAER